MKQHPIHPEIQIDEYWPMTGPLDDTDITDDAGDWILAMTGGGALSLWSRNEELPGDLLTVYRHPDYNMFLQFFTVFCRLGYETDARYRHQDGAVYIFNWRSFTLFQLDVARRVIHLFANGDINAAWEFGKWADGKINAATNAAVEVFQASRVG